MRAAVNFDVCLSIMRSELKGYRGYPEDEMGEKRFARALQDVAVSVDHLLGILGKMTKFFPTVQEIIDTGVSTRLQYEQQVDPRKEWEREYGKSQHYAPLNEAAMHWQAMRDALYYNSQSGLSELRNKYGSTGMEKSQAYWARALEYDIRVHEESVIFVQKQVNEMGWPAIMKLENSPVPMPYTNPLKETKAKTGMKQIAAGLPPRIAPEAPRELPEPEAASEPPADDDGWDDPDR